MPAIAEPVTLNGTSTLRPEAVESVIVTVVIITFSATLLLATANCAVGEASSSVMVAVVLGVADSAAPPVAPESARPKISFASSSVSCCADTVKVLLISPSAKLSVPLVPV